VTGGVVIVGYDGSAAALDAVEWAARTAATLRAELRIVHAVGLLEHAGLGSAGGVDDDPAFARVEVAGIDRAQVQWCVVDGDPTSALLRAAGEAQEDGGPVVLVVGSRGAGGHAGTLLGSTSLELAEHSPVPVTIVPSPGEPRRGR
jgi:nucleotide-binding universal stress UspA family protein